MRLGVNLAHQIKSLAMLRFLLFSSCGFFCVSYMNENRSYLPLHTRCRTCGSQCGRRSTLQPIPVLSGMVSQPEYLSSERKQFCLLSVSPHPLACCFALGLLSRFLRKRLSLVQCAGDAEFTWARRYSRRRGMCRALCSGGSHCSTANRSPAVGPVCEAASCLELGDCCPAAVPSQSGIELVV
jgi:hypothetical protein